MRDTAPIQGKWSALVAALGSVLPEYSDNVLMALDFFPAHELGRDPISADGCEADGTCCDMPLDPNPVVPPGTAIDEVVDLLEAAQPAGRSPTAAALARALAYYGEGQARPHLGEKHVVLLSDGGPDCNPDLHCDRFDCVDVEGEVGATCTEMSCVGGAAAVAQIDALRDAGIATHVIGLPGSDAYAYLFNDYAEAAGVVTGDEMFFYVRPVENVHFEAALRTVLERVVDP